MEPQTATRRLIRSRRIRMEDGASEDEERAKFRWLGLMR
jgi:hypothetical protein